MDLQELTISELKLKLEEGTKEAKLSWEQKETASKGLKLDFEVEMKKLFNYFSLLRGESVLFKTEKDSNYEVTINNYKNGFGSDVRRMEMTHSSARVKEGEDVSHLVMIGEIAKLFSTEEFKVKIDNYTTKLYNVYYKDYRCSIDCNKVRNAIDKKEHKIIKDKVISEIYSGAEIVLNESINFAKWTNYQTFKYIKSTAKYDTFEVKQRADGEWKDTLKIKKTELYTKLGCYIEREQKNNYILELTKKGINLPKEIEFWTKDYKTIKTDYFKLIEVDGKMTMETKDETHEIVLDNVISKLNWTNEWEIRDIN